MTINLPWDKYLGIFKLVILLQVPWGENFMVMRVSNKNIHNYKYTKRKMHLKRKTVKEANISFGDIFENIERLKDKGLISASSIDISIANAIRRLN
jgi:hypothetical protein